MKINILATNNTWYVIIIKREIYFIHSFDILRHSIRKQNTIYLNNHMQLTLQSLNISNLILTSET